MSTPLVIAVVVVFTLTYGLIAARQTQLVPLGRPTFALLGAVTMVALGALSPAQAYAAIDGDTISLLLGMMLLTVYCEDAGLLERIASLTLDRCRSPRGLLVAVSFLSAGLSAVLVNDTVCLFLTPIVVGICRRSALPFGPYLIALATCANIGSAATLVGNPQNMIIAGRSGLSFLEFLAVAGPVSLAALLLNVALLLAFYSRQLCSCAFEQEKDPSLSLVQRRGARRSAMVLVGVLAGFTLGWHMGLVALGAAGLLIALHRKDPGLVFARVDWPLLVF
ncbi:MAG: SLC13 family permease, partial [Myxococcota bacterium]|nr:SLC13 family permease [Myxococcota bacterium]